MTRYAHVDTAKREIIQIYDELPTSWENYSNFNLMDAEGLKALGWLPVIDMTDVPEYNRLFDEVVTRYTIGEDQVYRNYFIQPYDPQTNEAKRQVYMARLRDIRGNLLRESDWSVLPDMIEARGDAWKTQWSSYRQQLRDFPSQYENLEVASLPNLEDLPWPTPPAL